MSAILLCREQYDDACIRLVESGEGLAELTDYPRLHPAHLFLALAGEPDTCLDSLLRERMRGLKAETIADSLREILEIAAPGDGIAHECAGGLLTKPCTSEAAKALEKAVDLASAWGKAKATPEALMYVMLGDPEGFILDAFGDAGVQPDDVRGLGRQAAAPPINRRAQEVFDSDIVRLAAFGPMAVEAFRTLTQLGSGGLLTAEHLLIALISIEKSRTVEALHLMRLQPDAMIRTLVNRHGEIDGPRGKVLETRRLGRMLKGIVQNSAQIALLDGVDVIGESQIMRAYIDRVGQSEGNTLDRLGINARRLDEYLKKYLVDRSVSERDETGGPIQDMQAFLANRVLAQEHAIATVLPALKRMRTGLNQPGKLMGKFLFLGPAGVGKTELAKAIADVAFGPKPGVCEPYLIRIECGSLGRPDDIVRLIGASQGLVGYKDGALTNGLRDKGKNCVILFDEAEKAHPAIWQKLLTFFGEGIVLEADGTRYDATGCILIATSNLGYREAIEKFRIFDLTPQQAKEVVPKFQEFIWSYVANYFSPEFLSRFGRQYVVYFNHFHREHYQKMIAAQLLALEGEMRGRGIALDVDPDLTRVLTSLAWDARAEGARCVERLVTEHARDHVVNEIAQDVSCGHVTIRVTQQLRDALHARSAKNDPGGTVVQAFEDYLLGRVVNQEHAIRAVTPALKRMRAGLNEPGRLMGVFLFLGATGVGKTELARAVADIAFGTKPGAKDSYLILINCGALKDPRDIVQLFGAPQGLKGYKEGALTNGLRDKGGRCVILFDEVEKAHPDIWQSLLQLFDEGIVMEADGTQYDATGCILIATSNLGYKEAIEKFNLFDRPAAELQQLQPKVEEFVWKQVVKYFSLEFRGRFGRENVIFFNHFTRDAYLSMLKRQGAALIEEMLKHDITVQVEDPVYEALAALAWSKRTEGARPVRRLITTNIRDRIVDARVNDPDQHEITVGLTEELTALVNACSSSRNGETDVEGYLNARVINQTHAAKALAPAVRRMRSGMNEPGRLLGSFLFLGPSGVGKTELAKAIAEVAFGPQPGVVDPYLIRIDCGRLHEARDIVQLLGAAQGYVGYKEGVLTNGLRDKGSRCVIVFDEAEKAHAKTWQSLLTFFDEGIVMEADGTRYDATCCILIATSNLGYKEAIDIYRMFELSPHELFDLRPQIEEFIWQKVCQYFSPEFLGRFGRENVILFNHFDLPAYRKIVDVQATGFETEMAGRGLSITVPPEVRQRLAEMAWENRQEGARTVRRLITVNLRDKVVEHHSSNPEHTEFHFGLWGDGSVDVSVR